MENRHIFDHKLGNEIEKIEKKFIEEEK